MKFLIIDNSLLYKEPNLKHIFTTREKYTLKEMKIIIFFLVVIIATPYCSAAAIEGTITCTVW